MGNSQTFLRVRELEVQVNDIILRKDIKTAMTLIGMVQRMSEKLYFFQRLAVFVSECDLLFDDFKWVNKSKARKLIDMTKKAIEEETVTIEQLDNYTDMIWSMQIHEHRDQSSDTTSTAQSSNVTVNPTSNQTINEEKCKRLLT